MLSLMFYVYIVFIYLFIFTPNYILQIQFSIFLYLSGAQLWVISLHIVLEVIFYLISDSYLPRYYKFLLSY